MSARSIDCGASRSHVGIREKNTGCCSCCCRLVEIFVNVLLRLLSILLPCLLMQIITSKPSKTRRYIPRHRESVIQNSHAARQKRDDHAHARDKMRERTSHFWNTQEYRVCFLSHFASCWKVERQSAFFGIFRTEFLNRPEPRTRRYRWLAGFKEECRRSCFP